MTGATASDNEAALPRRWGDPEVPVAREPDVERCHYCRQPFSEERPPTVDHVVPRFYGGTRNEGTVLACQECNGARGHCPYQRYMAAVEREHAAAAAEGRPYRRVRHRYNPRTSWSVLVTDPDDEVQSDA